MAYKVGTTQGDGEMTFQQIGDALGVSRQGAKYIYSAAIKKLQNDKKLKEYWHGLIAEQIGTDSARRVFHSSGLDR